MRIDEFVWNTETRELTILAGGDRQTFLVTPGIAEALIETLEENE